MIIKILKCIIVFFMPANSIFNLTYFRQRQVKTTIISELMFLHFKMMLFHHPQAKLTLAFRRQHTKNQSQYLSFSSQAFYCFDKYMVSMCWFLVKYRQKAHFLLLLLLNLLEADGDLLIPLLVILR